MCSWSCVWIWSWLCPLWVIPDMAWLPIYGCVFVFCQVMIGTMGPKYLPVTSAQINEKSIQKITTTGWIACEEVEGDQRWWQCHRASGAFTQVGSESGIDATNVQHVATEIFRPPHGAPDKFGCYPRIVLSLYQWLMSFIFSNFPFKHPLAQFALYWHDLTKLSLK